MFKFEPGDVVYYKPGDFAPLQVIAGGTVTVLRQLQTPDGDRAYCIRLPDGQQRIVSEHELTVPAQP